MLKHFSKFMMLGWVLVGTTGTVVAQRIIDDPVVQLPAPARLVAHAEASELPLPAAGDAAPRSGGNGPPRMIAGAGGSPVPAADLQPCSSCNHANCYGSCYHQFATELQPNGSPPLPRQIFKRIWQADQQYFQSQMTPPCPGHFVNQFWEVQKGNGRLAQYVFYGFHFSSLDVDPQGGLTKSGRTKVMEIARIWQLTPGPIYLIPSGDPQIDQSRLNVALQALNQHGLPISPDYMMLADPSGPSLMGVEANQFFLQRLQGSPLNPVMGAQGGGSQSTVGGGR